MEHLEKLIKLNPFKYDADSRNKIFFNAVLENFNHQLSNSPEFKNWSNINNVYDSKDIHKIEDVPFFPSSIFKYAKLSSTDTKFKSIESSGTTSQIKSKIYLDKENAKRQTVVLIKILSGIFGQKRRPFLIVDADLKTKKSDIELSARYAGMSGYLMAASERNYILNDSDKSLELNIDELEKIIESFNKKNEPIIIIGYTYLVYEKLLMKLKDANIKLKCHKDTMFVHFGGWKKLKKKQISKLELNNSINKFLGIKEKNIIDIYGFTEQLGTVYPSSGMGGCKVPAYSELIVRDPQNLRPVPDGEQGFLQFISPIAYSYPGLSIMNDDLGRIVTRNNNVVEFEVLGRPENSEPRGCGDTLPENFLI